MKDLIKNDADFFKDFKNSNIFQGIFNHLETLDEKEIINMTIKNTSSTIKIERLKKPDTSGALYKAIIRHRDSTYTLKFTSKQKALTFKQDMIEAMKIAKPSAIRGRAVHSELDKPHLNFTLGSLYPSYLLYIQNDTVAYTARAKAFFIGIEKAGKSKTTLKELFDATKVQEIIEEGLKAYKSKDTIKKNDDEAIKKRKKSNKKQRKGKELKGSLYIEFVKTDIFNKFYSFLKDYIEKRKKDIEINSMYQDAFFNQIYKDKVKEVLEEINCSVDKRPPVMAKDVDVDEFVKKIMRVMIKSNDLKEIQYCLYAILNSFLGFRQNEFNALRIEDIEFENNRIVAKHSISKKGVGAKYMWNETKTGKNIQYVKNITENELKIIDYLLSPLFSAGLSKFYGRCNKNGEFRFMVKDKSLHKHSGKSFGYKDMSLGEYLFKSNGIDEINKFILSQPIKIKRTLLIENLQNQVSDLADTATGPFKVPKTEALKKLSEKHGMKYIPAHSRYRKGIATKFFKMYGAEVAKNFMGWKDMIMVQVYVAVSEESQKSGSSIVAVNLDFDELFGGDGELTRESVLEKLSSGVKFEDLSETERKLL